MKKILLFLLLFAAGKTLHAQTLQLDSTTLTLTVAIDSTQVVIPWDIEWGFDDRLWVSDGRRIKAWDPATNTMSVLFTKSYGYFCGLAVPKELPVSGPVYVYAILDTAYYYAGSSQANLVKYTYDIVNDTLTDPDTLLTYMHMGEHSGGKVIIGNDGKIWLTTPEFTYADDTIGGTRGRTLRINPDGSYPAGNLHADYTYSIGHRNAQGMVQLPDGTVFCTEHSGPSIRDEINLISLGGHYGWPAMEGYGLCSGLNNDSCNSPTYITSHRDPVYSGTMTPAGLDYYNHPAIPEWQNCLLVGTLWSPDTCLAVFKLSNDHDSVLNRRNYLKKNAGGINDFKRTRDVCVAPDGSIYFLVHDRSFAQPGDTLVNVGCKVIRMKNNAYVSTPAIVNASVSLKIYPNPALDRVAIELGNFQQPVSYKVIDHAGRLIYRGMLNKKVSYINTSEWLPGAYEFIFDEIAATKKVVVIH